MGNIGHKPTTFDKLCLRLSLVGCRKMSRKPNDTLLLMVTTFIGVILGFLVGVSVPLLSVSKVWDS